MHTGILVYVCTGTTVVHVCTGTIVVHVCTGTTVVHVHILVKLENCIMYI